jgi:hypothetical protein
MFFAFIYTGFGLLNGNYNVTLMTLARWLEEIL